MTTPALAQRIERLERAIWNGCAAKAAAARGDRIAAALDAANAPILADSLRLAVRRAPDTREAAVRQVREAVVHTFDPPCPKCGARPGADCERMERGHHTGRTAAQRHTERVS